MATRTWSSSGSTDMNDSANYSGSGALLTTDDLVFDATSTVDAIATAVLSVKSITTTSGFSGAWNANTYAITTANGFSFDSTGAVNVTGTMTVSGDGDFHIGSGVGTLTTTSTVLDLQGTGNLDIDKTSTFRQLKCAYSGKTTTNTSGTNITIGHTTTLLTLGTGTLTNNRQLNLFITGANVICVNAGATINGTADILFACNNASASTVTMPAFNYSGSGAIHVYSRVTGTFTVNFAGNITCGSLLLGLSAASTSITYNFGSYTFNCTTFAINYSTGPSTLNLQTSTINCGGNLTLAANTTVDAGTSTINITNTSTITTEGETLGNIVINATTKTIDLNDALTCADLTVTAGTFDTDGFAVTCDDLSITDMAILTGSDVTISGNYTSGSSSTVTIDASTTFSFSKNGAVVTTNGKALPQCTFNDNYSINDGCTIARIIWGAAGKTGTFEAGQVFVISNLTAANWNGTDGNLNAFRSSSTGNAFVLELPNAVTLEYVNPKDCLIKKYLITVTDGTSVDGGNNTNWRFSTDILTAQNIAYTSSIDGYNLTYDIGYDTAGGVKPLLLICYGYSQAKSNITADTHKRFVTYGFTTICANIRGRGASGGTSDDGCREIQDLIDAIVHFRARNPEYVHATKVFVTGYSGGGMMALRLAITRPDFFGGVVDHFGIADHVDWYDINDASGKTVIETRVGGTPVAVPDNYTTRYSISAAKNIAARFHMLHDNEDPSVPVAHSDDVNTALTAAGNTNYVYTRTTSSSANRATHGLPVFADTGEVNVQFETMRVPTWVTEFLSGSYDSCIVPASGTHRVLGHIANKRYELYLNDWQTDVVECSYDVTGTRMLLTINNTITANEITAKLVVYGMTPETMYTCSGQIETSNANGVITFNGIVIDGNEIITLELVELTIEKTLEWYDIDDDFVDIAYSFDGGNNYDIAYAIVANDKVNNNTKDILLPAQDTYIKVIGHTNTDDFSIYFYDHATGTIMPIYLRLASLINLPNL